MKPEPLERPFVFRPSPDTLMAFKDASAEDKLNWLEEANQFVNDFVSPEKLAVWKRISGR
jgi:hypothetical protein